MIRNLLHKIINDRRASGVALALPIMVFYGCSYDWKCGLALGICFALTGFLSIQWENPWLSFLANGIWAMVCLVVSCVIPTEMVSQVSFFEIGAYRVVMNIVCAAVMYGVCLTITGRIRPAVILASGLLLILALINAFVFRFRGNEFKATDIYAMKTAWNVMGQYTFKLSGQMAFCLIVWLLLMFVGGGLPRESYPISAIWIRLGAGAATLMAFAVLCFGARVIHPNNWSNGGSENNGYFLNFVVGIRDAVVEEPEGYSSEMIRQMESRYRDTEEGGTDSKQPNIVIIMSESFSDVRVMGDNLRTNQPVTPFLDSLTENVVRGYALTPVFGGVTANAEFEVLTGASMAFMPGGSVPYQQYIYSSTGSLVRLVEDVGYKSFATHPYYSSGWNRTTVYPYLGFDRMTFDDAYNQNELVREYISDNEMYRYVTEALEKEDAPLFLFGITMQNHGDYIYTGDNYTQSIYLEGYREPYPMAEQYLTLLRLTDVATEGFLKELENLQEDTVVLFFGDHFPQIESSFFEEVHGKTFDTLSERMLQYTVPFFVWANYEIPEKNVELTSLSYLPIYLLECAGVEMPAYYRFLKDMEAQIPAINPMGYYSKSAGSFLPLEEAKGEEAEWIRMYEKMQYNMLFGKEGRSSLFFPVTEADS